MTMMLDKIWESMALLPGEMWAIGSLEKLQFELQRIADAWQKGVEYGPESFFSLGPNTDDNEKKPYVIVNSVALIPFVGPILKSAPRLLKWFGIDAVGGKEMLRLLDRAESDNDVKSIKLLIDSPGGLATVGADLADRVANFSKPTEAQISNLCASAAYQVASHCNRVVSSKNAYIGSIGSIIVVPDYSKLYAELGVEIVAIKSSDLKAIGIEGTEVTENHRKELERLVIESADDFVRSVSDARGVDYKTVKDKWATGQVFKAETALKLGMIDFVITLSTQNEDGMNNTKKKEPFNEMTAREKELTDKLAASEAARKKAESVAALHAQEKQAAIKTQKDTLIEEAIKDGVSPTLRESMEKVSESFGDDIDGFKTTLDGMARSVATKPKGHNKEQPAEVNAELPKGTPQLMQKLNRGAGGNVRCGENDVHMFSSVKAVNGDGTYTLMDGSIVDAEKFMTTRGGAS